MKHRALWTGIIAAVFFTVFPQANGFAELRIDSVAPNLGTMGQDLEVTITGRGFDENTRVSVYVDSGNKRAVLGSVDTPGSADDIEIVDGIAYVADGSSGLQIIDVKNPLKPVIIGSVDTPYWAGAVSISGTTAYVADGYSGLQVVDVSNPQNPVIIGSVDTPQYAKHVSLCGTMVYIADSASGLQIIDVSNPLKPIIIGSVDTPGVATSVSISGTMAYVADYSYGLQVIDVSNPQKPVIIGFVDSRYYNNDISVSGNVAYVADGILGLTVIDISNPQNPVIIGWVNTPGDAKSINISGTTAYVADEENGLQVIDVSNPRNPFIIGSVRTPNDADALAIFGTTAYVVNRESGLQVMDVSNPQHQNIGSVDTPGYARDLHISGTTAYVADYSSGLQVIDVSNSQNPVIVGSVDTPSFASDLHISGTTVYVADEGAVLTKSALQVIDISNPSNPVIVGSVDTTGWGGMDICVSGTTAFAADSTSGLQVIDVSNPQNPSIIGHVETPDSADGVSISGTTAYVADHFSGLQIIDVSNPQSPIIIGSVDTPGVSWDVCISETTAYVANGTSGLQVIDVSNPQNPVIIGSVDTPGYARAVNVSGTTAYVADGDLGLQMIDISNPHNPVIIGYLDTPGVANNVSISKSIAYVADGITGLTVLPLPVEITPITVNSSTSLTATLPSPQIPGHYIIRVFNSNGESHELPGAVTFVEPDSAKLSAKAIVVAGRGPSDTLWPQTRMVADHAYEMLKVQGYTDERIMYLSSDTGSPSVDGYADTSALSSAVTQWAADASGLLLYFVGHGDDQAFNLNPFETLGASALRTWLDGLQTAMPGPVVFVYDACLSGTFLPKLAAPDKRRILISSGSDENVWFVNYGYTSFSFQFWSTVSTDANLNDAFSSAEFTMSAYQSAQLDANGNGKPGETEDMTIAASTWIGRGRIVEPDPSPIEAVSPPATLYGATTAAIWADILSAAEKDIEKVWAIVIKPDDPDQITFNELALLDTNSDGRYEGNFSGFTVKGTYIINIYAKDARNNIFQSQTTVTQTVGTEAASPDAYEDDDVYTRSGTILVNDETSQEHHFHDAGDTDWVRFHALAGRTYQIRGFNLSPVCDLVVQVVDRDGATMLMARDSRPAGGEESLYWTCPADGIYFARFSNKDSSVFGETVSYEMEIFQPYLSDSGMITGFVVDSSSNPIPGARVKTDGDGSNLSREDGSYMIRHRPGAFTISAEADGYGTAAYPVTVEKAAVQSRIIILPSCSEADPGDVNNDTSIDLTDAILALQAITGVTVSQTVCKEADVNGDERIGLEDAVFILRAVGQ